MADYFHFLRPWWLLALLPWLLFLVRLWRKKSASQAWEAVCDPHLLSCLIQHKGRGKRRQTLFCLFASSLLMIFSLAGPAWTRLPVPVYQALLPRVVILDMSEAMLNKDLSPDRLTRARFRLRDFFKLANLGQTGMVVYTSEPFVVSPLTEDTKTIDALLESLTPDVMPVGGQRLDSALEEGMQLIRQAGFTHGQLVVLTSTPPDSAAVNKAASLAAQGFLTSVIPIVARQADTDLFQSLAKAGQGRVFPFIGTEADLEKWLELPKSAGQFVRSQQNALPLWKDEGRLLLFPALLLLLPVLRRNWLQRIGV